MVLEGPCTRDTPCGGRERGATGVFGRGVAATPLLHTQNCGMSCGRGVATTWSATGGGGGCSVCPTNLVTTNRVYFNVASTCQSRNRTSPALRKVALEMSGRFARGRCRRGRSELSHFLREVAPRASSR